MGEAEAFDEIQRDQIKLRLVQQLAKGKSSKEIAWILDCSETDVENLRRKIFKDTRSINIAHFMFHAMSRKVI